MNRHFSPRGAGRTTPAPAPNEPPIAAWLHIGPNSAATVCVSFIGTHKRFSLTATQAWRLRKALDEAMGIVARDDGESRRSVSYKLLEGS